MSEHNYNQIAESLSENNDFGENSVEDVAEKLEQYIEDFGVPVDEAKRSVIDSMAVSSEPDEEAIEVNIGEIDTQNQRVDVRVKVVHIFDDNHESIYQAGLIGDESGVTKYTEFKSDSETMELEEGECYLIEGAKTDLYNGQYNIQFSENTVVTHLEDEDIEVDDSGGNQQSYELVVVDVNEETSGLIKRCPEEDCTRVLDNGRCGDHGSVDGEFDLRMKVIGDNGEEAVSLYINRDELEEYTGLTLEEAKETASEEMDRTVVLRDLTPEFLGNYFAVTGNRHDYGLTVQELEEIGPDYDEAETLLDEMEESLMEARSQTAAADGGDA